MSPVSSSLPTTSFFSTFSKFQFCPPSFSSSCPRVICHGGSNVQHMASDLKFFLHDALDASGIDTVHARVKTHVLVLQILRLFLFNEWFYLLNLDVLI